MVVLDVVVATDVVVLLVDVLTDVVDVELELNPTPSIPEPNTKLRILIQM